MSSSFFQIILKIILFKGNQVQFLFILFITISILPAQTDTSLEQNLFTTNNTWMLIAAFLVFIMHLGFATLESGLTRAKNSVNILFKNVSIVAIGILNICSMWISI